jgi:hypothetical protein|tara:strand:+ start:676 stop:837 length:162 start_codon:yes stop_codon:yes gene_type:complete
MIHHSNIRLGVALARWQITPARFAKLFLDGYRYVPLCDNHDDKGRCKGHPDTP